MNQLIHRKITIIMLFTALSMLGYVSYKQLSVEIYPNAELPMLYVQIGSRIEVTPEYMEKEGVIPVEGVVGGLEGIERIESYATVNRGMVNVYYEKGVDLKYAYLKMQEKINALQSQLPDGFILQVVKADTDMKSNVLMGIQVRGSGGTDRIRNFCDQQITPELENVDGVAGVMVFGGTQKSVDIMLDRNACDAYGLTPARIKNLLNKNLQSKAFGGAIKEKGKRYFVYVTAEFVSVKELENIPIGRGEARLKNVAEVFYGEKEETSISRINGKESVTMIVMNDAQVNVIDLSHTIRNVIDNLNSKNKTYDIEMVVQQNQAEIMEENIDQIINLAITGGILAIFILWVFLGNLAQVSVVALAIPVSVFTAFNFFYGFNISINSLTLVGIALAMGMLIDNGVVVLENIYRLRANGYNATDAVVKGTKEVWRSVFAATLTTIAIFIPFIFSPNYLIKMLGKNVGVSVISTLAVSLVVALLLIPMATHAFLKRGNGKNTSIINTVSLDNRWVRVYLLLLKTGLRNPAVVVVGGVALFFITVFGSLAVSVNTSTQLESSQISVNVVLPTGYTLEKTNEVVLSIEEKIDGVDEIEDVLSEVEEEQASITIKLKEDYQKINKRSVAEIRTELESRTKDVSFAELEFSTQSSAMGGMGGDGGGMRNRTTGAQGFQSLMGIGEDEEYLVVRGQDFELMSMVSEDLQYYLEELDNMRRVRLSVKENQPEYHISFDGRAMADYNISRSGIASELSSFQSEVASGVNFKQGTEEYEIIIKYSDDTAGVSSGKNKNYKTIDDLKQLSIANDANETNFELQWFSDIYQGNGLRRIDRVNQSKQIEISYQFQSDVYDSKTLLEASQQEIRDVVASYNLPSGIALEFVQKESEIKEFYVLMYIAMILIFMILAAVFESLTTPFVLLFSIPLAATGSFLALLMTGNSLFNANTLTGFLILLGVVVNNGIILIDFTNILQKKGVRKSRALLTAGLSRLRPILITATTTCVAMIPLALGKAEYVSAIGAPFAITVIGGLTVSTLLTLVYIPALYSGLDSALSWIRSLKWLVHLIMWTVMVLGGIWVILVIESVLWQIADIFLLIVGIPAITFFVLSSLRKASTTLMGKDDVLFIKIQNLVKIYDRPGQFSREWIGGKNLSAEQEGKNEVKNALFKALIWQIPLLAFLHYFLWIYIQPGFWIVPISILVYVFQLSIISKVLHLKQNILYKLFYYISPLAFLIGIYLKNDNLTLSIIIGILWYITIGIQQVRFMMQKQGSKAKHYKGIKRVAVFMVSNLPLVGKVKVPFKALGGVSLEISTGMFGLLGPNGAGKSTLMRIIVGIYEQSYGKIWINGIDTMEKREELQSLIGFLPQEFGMYENMSAWQYLDYQAILKGLKEKSIREERLKYVLKAVHMYDNRDDQIGSFSGGMKQRIGIAQILLFLPRILIVDEPTAGLDPRERIRFRNLLVELSQDRIVIFSTHIIEDISSSCNNMAVVNNGMVIYRGSPNDMTEYALGHVWSFHVQPANFESTTKNMLVVHHMRQGDHIKVRCIAEDKPVPEAESVLPLLEDAYLYMIQKHKATGKV